MANIKSILGGTKVALEKQASDKFGAAVEDFTRGRLGPALGLPDPQKVDPKARNDGSFYASSYAAALAGGTSYRPKLKFLFKVQFVFTPEALAAYPDIGSNDFTFMVRSVDRPKIDFEYEDDVNMYNFRTKVLKKIRHRELTITFMDDTGNRVLNFFRHLMMIHSPITRRQLARDGTTANPDPGSVSAGHGMMFSPVNKIDFDDTASRGVFNSNIGAIIDCIRVKQMFVDPSEAISNAMKEVIFDFMNVRLVSFDLDDLNHETSDVNLMTMQFDYDWMEIVDVGSLSAPDGPDYNISTPGINGAPVDVSPAGGATNQQGRNNPFADILTRSLGRGAQSITSSAISRGIQSIAGNGRFANIIGSQVSGIAGGLVGAASQNLTSGFTNNLINQAGAGLSTGINSVRNFILPPTTPAIGVQDVNDSAVGGPAEVTSVVSSDGDGS